MIINLKPRDCKHGRSQGARVGRRFPSKIKKYFWAILRAFLLRFSHFGGLFATFYFENKKIFLGYIEGLFATFFSFWGPFCYFLLHGGGLFWACPPPTKISAGTHDCKEGSRACSREIFLCDRNLVSSGHVLLRFCLKNDKNNNKL